MLCSDGPVDVKLLAHNNSKAKNEGADLFQRVELSQDNNSVASTVTMVLNCHLIYSFKSRLHTNHKGCLGLKIRFRELSRLVRTWGESSS